MADLKIKVGAALDASLNSVFRTAIDAAKRANKSVAAEAKAGAKEAADAYRSVDKERLKEQLRLEKEQTKQAARESKERAKIAAQEAREKAKADRTTHREREAQERAMTRLSIQNIRERHRFEERQKADAARSRTAANRRALGFVAGAGRAALGFGARFAGDVARGIGIDTDMGSRLGASAARETTAVQIANSAWIPEGGPESAKNRVSAKSLLTQANQVGTETATSAEEALGGLQEFVTLTGDLQTGRDILKDMSVLSKATGSSLGDMMKAASQISNAMGDMKDKGPAISQAMRVFSGQGQLGAIEIRDLAGQMAKLTAQANNFKLSAGTKSVLESKGVHNEVGQNLAMMGAMAQAARAQGGRASASQATQSAMAFIRDLSSKTELKRMSAAGINVFADKGHTTARDPKEIIMDVLSKSRGNLATISQLLPNQNSRAVVNAFAQTYTRTAGGLTRNKGESDFAFAQRKNKEGLEAVSEAFDGYLKVAMQSPEITDKFNAAMDTTESKVQQFNNHLAQSADELRENLYPALVQLTPMVMSAAKSFADFVGLVTGKTGHEQDVRATGAEIGARNVLGSVSTDMGRPGAAEDVSAARGDLSAALATQRAEKANLEASLAHQGVDGRKDDLGALFGKVTGIDVANQTKLAAVNSTIARMQDDLSKLDSLKGSIDLLRSTTLTVRVANMPNNLPGSAPAGMPVASQP